MKDFFGTLIEKLNDILYEVIGLLLPTLILCMVLVEPLFYMRNFSWKNIKTNDFWGLLEGNVLFLLILFIIAIFYVVGNVIKVVSKLYYKLGEAVVDDTLWVIISWIYSKILYPILWFIYYKILHPIFYPIYYRILLPVYNKTLLPIYNEVYEKNKESKHNPNDIQKLEKESRENSDDSYKLGEKLIVVTIYVLVKWLWDTLAFKTDSYGKDFEDLYINLAGKNSITFSDEKDKEKKFFLFYKIATTILNQNNINTLYYKFLSKYNSFRSIEFVFFCGIIYNMLFCHSCIDFERYFIVLGVNVVCLIGFHEKFKRYWKLCGNEVILGLDYYYKNMEGKSEKQNIVY